ncbi:uncharacterized protein VTP21DRAFT_7137 [Calcarisporiella thermophila]|uniref:uncharacterized protein n=1 Tax=Calcarisporiella thermophila TaxID=911321 RepID=UPI00374251D8
MAEDVSAPSITDHRKDPPLQDDDEDDAATIIADWEPQNIDSLPPLAPITTTSTSNTSMITANKMIPATESSTTQSLALDARSTTGSSLSSMPKESTKRKRRPKDKRPGRRPTVILDRSVIMAIMDHVLSSPIFEARGYLGGAVIDGTSIGSEYSGRVLRISHFYPSERLIPSLLTDDLEEAPGNLEKAEQMFNQNGLICVGWYRSDRGSGVLSPTTKDLKQQVELQSKIPLAVGMLLRAFNTTQISPATSDMDIGVHSHYDLSLFEATLGEVKEPHAEMKDLGNAKEQDLTHTPRISKGTAHILDYHIHRQAYSDPSILQQSAQTLLVTMREMNQAYAAQVLDCENRTGQRLFVDTHYEGYLVQFWRDSVIRLRKSIDQDFTSLALSKIQLKRTIADRIENILHLYQQPQRQAGERRNSNIKSSSSNLSAEELRTKLLTTINKMVNEKLQSASNKSSGARQKRRHIYVNGASSRSIDDENDRKEPGEEAERQRNLSSERTSIKRIHRRSQSSNEFQISPEAKKTKYEFPVPNGRAPSPPPPGSKFSPHSAVKMPVPLPQLPHIPASNLGSSSSYFYSQHQYSQYPSHGRYATSPTESWNSSPQYTYGQNAPEPPMIPRRATIPGGPLVESTLSPTSPRLSTSTPTQAPSTSPNTTATSTPMSLTQPSSHSPGANSQPMKRTNSAGGGDVHLPGIRSLLLEPSAFSPVGLPSYSPTTPSSSYQYPVPPPPPPPSSAQPQTPLPPQTPQGHSSHSLGKNSPSHSPSSQPPPSSSSAPYNPLGSPVTSGSTLLPSTNSPP